MNFVTFISSFIFVLPIFLSAQFDTCPETLDAITSSALFAVKEKLSGSAVDLGLLEYSSLHSLDRNTQPGVPDNCEGDALLSWFNLPGTSDACCHLDDVDCPLLALAAIGLSGTDGTEIVLVGENDLTEESVQTLIGDADLSSLDSKASIGVYVNGKVISIVGSNDAMIEECIYEEPDVTESPGSPTTTPPPVSVSLISTTTGSNETTTLAETSTSSSAAFKFIIPPYVAMAVYVLITKLG